MLRIATEKGGEEKLVEVPAHRDLIDAIDASDIGSDVFAGKRIGT